MYKLASRNKFKLLFTVIVVIIFQAFLLKPKCIIIRQSMSRVYSSQVKDSFDIQIRERIVDWDHLLLNPVSSITSIYILDSEIDSRVARLYDSLDQRDTTSSFRIIGIGQTSFSNVLRKRDFVPSSATGFFSSQAQFLGHSDDFYRFVIDDVMSIYDKNSNRRVLVGHSFGGLFGVYLSTLDSSGFDMVYALSPSLWVNYSDFISNYQNDTSIVFGNEIEIVYGGMEHLNKVAPSVKSLQAVLRPKDMKNVTTRKVDWATHMSILEEIYGLAYIK